MPAIKALIIDDSEDDRGLVKRALARAEEDYEIVEALSRPELEEKLAAEEFDLVISDFNILGLDGLEVLEIVRTVRPDTPVILLTGTGNEEVAVAALKRGAADYVVKSVKHIKKLPATVTAVLDRAGLARERKSLEEALGISEEKYRSLVETAREAVLSVDEDGLVTFSSRGAELMFGCSSEEMVGKSFTTLVPQVVRDAFGREVVRHLGRQTATAGCGIMATSLTRKDGEEFPAEVSFSNPGASNGGAFTAVIRDVTEKKRLEEEVSRLDRLAAIGEMTTGIAHEVRNPLAAIATSAAVAKHDLASVGLDTESADWILEGVRKVEKLLKRFFDFARPLTPERQRCDVNALIREVVKSEDANLTASDVTVELKSAEGAPPVFVDPGLMKSVFTNVVVNARQAMPEGGILRIRSELGGADWGTITLSFADTGQGISPEEAKRALEPFFTTKPDGVGLGLPLCFKIIKAHGGELTIAGREVGSEVTITLPVAER